MKFTKLRTIFTKNNANKDRVVLRRE